MVKSKFTFTFLLKDTTGVFTRPLGIVKPDKLVKSTSDALRSPFTVKLLQFPIANESGCPNGYGLVLHGIVFLVLIRLLMSINLPRV